MKKNNTQNKPKYYHYGYRFIKPQDEEKDWDYAVQMHKNQNGTHFDFRLAKPGQDFAYSWASRKVPINITSPVMARRTQDHSLSHLDFEGPLDTAKGTGTVKLLKRGKTKLHSIDDKGLKFKLDTGEYLLMSNIKGKKYMLTKPE
jgi:hypothetical protein